VSAAVTSLQVKLESVRARSLSDHYNLISAGVKVQQRCFSVHRQRAIPWRKIRRTAEYGPGHLALAVLAAASA
jgi:hypothetical protein